MKSLQPRIALAVALAAFLSLSWPARAAATEYFVKTDGNDSLPGTSLENAMSTIQKAANRLMAGDTLTIAPGEYLQSFVVRQNGTADKPITIRAAIPGFSVVRGSVPIRTFEKVAGKRFVWSTPPMKTVYRVVELDSQAILLEAPALEDMDQFRKSYIHDQASRRLFLHTSDGQSPDNHKILGTILAGHGIEITGEYIHLDGLVVRGFFPPSLFDAGRGFGLSLTGSHHEVRHCSFLYNGGGILVRAQHCVLSDNLLIGNVDPNYGELAQIFAGVGGKSIVVTNNTVLDGQTYAIRFYGASDATVTHNLVKNTRIGLDFKASAGTRIAEHNVVVDSSYLSYYASQGTSPLRENANTIEGQGAWDKNNQATPGADTLRFDPTKKDVHFVDPDHLDYRLQADSPFVNTKSGKSLGAMVFQADVFFVGPSGDDQSDGLSAARAFRTIRRAAAQLRPGTTLYLLEGNYDEVIQPPVPGTPDEPIIIRGRGRRSAVQVNGLNLSALSYIRVENLRIREPIVIRGASDVRIERCVLAHQPGPAVTLQDCRSTWLRRLTIWNTTGPAIALKGSNSGLQITNSILQSKNDVALAGEALNPSDSLLEYNNYLHGSNRPLAIVGGRQAMNISELHALTGADRYSISSDPQLILRGASFAIASSSCCARAGELHQNIGAGEVESMPLEPQIAEVKLRDVTPTSASITWWTPNTSNATWRPPAEWSGGFPVNSEIHYGVSQDSFPQIVHSFGDLYHRVTLHGLKPQTTYFFRIVIPDQPHVDTKCQPYKPAGEPANWARKESEVLAFKTPEAGQWTPTRRTFFVSPKGSPDSSGLSEASPTTLTAASDRVRAGDTVMLLDGIYEETFAPAASGAPDAPITIKARQAGRACLDGSGFLRPTALALYWKTDILIEGLVIRRFADKAYGSRAGFAHAQILILQSQDITVRDCVLAGCGSYGLGIIARGADRLTVVNNVLTNFARAVVGRQNGQVNLLNNTWYVPQIANFDLDGTVIVKNNLFFGQNPQKVVNYVPMVSVKKPTESDYNAFYFGPGNDVRYIGYGVEHNAQRDMGGLRTIQELAGTDKHSVEPPPEQVRLNGPAPTDYLNAQSLDQFRVSIQRGQLIPTLDMFVPPADSPLSTAGEAGQPIGARPSRPPTPAH